MSYKEKVREFIVQELYNPLLEKKIKHDKLNPKVGNYKKKIANNNKMVNRYTGNDKLSHQLNILKKIIEELELQ